MANGYGHLDARQRLGKTAEDVWLHLEEAGHGLLNVDAAVP